MHKGQQKIMGLARKALAEQERKEHAVDVLADLLEACKAAFSYFDVMAVHTEWQGAVFNQLTKAIAKAEAE